MYTAQITKDRIREICKSKKINAKNMLESCGLGFNAIQQITDAKGMASFSLAKIADYLGCSVDYLLGRTDDPESHIDKLSFLDERDHELVSSIIEKSYARSRSDVDDVSVHELPRFKAIAYGGDIVENKPLKKPKIPD